MLIFPHFGTFCLLVLQLILAEFSDLEQFENWAANCQFASKYESYGKWLHPRAKLKKTDPTLNSILSAKRQFSACFSNCSNSLNFEAKINCNTTRQNDLKWRKTCTGLKFDLVHFNGPQTNFIVDSL